MSGFYQKKNKLHLYFQFQMSYLREKSTKSSPNPNQKKLQPCSLEIFRKMTEPNQNNLKSYKYKIYKKSKIGTLLTESAIKKYIKCSKKGCPNIINLSNDIQSIQPIQCAALHQTCPTCFMPNHFAFDCSMVSIISETYDSIGKSSLWIIANSKKCPQCGEYIEKIEDWKSKGNLITCPCGRQFCWLCLSDYWDHKLADCERLNRELKFKQDYAKKINENYMKIENKFPNLEEKINNFESDLNLFEKSIKKHQNLNCDAEILSGIAGFIRESWISVFYGLNLSFLMKVRKAEKIETICCRIHDFLLPIMTFFRKIDKNNIKAFIRFLNEEKNVKILMELREDLRALQECIVDLKIINSPNIRL